jgi:hypothetical protein
MVYSCRAPKLLAAIRVFFRSRSDTALEVLALRQQLAVLKRKRPRPPLNSLDRLFWTMLLQRMFTPADECFQGYGEGHRLDQGELCKTASSRRSRRLQR